MTGLAHSTGDRVFLIDSDLEEEPEWSMSFARQMTEEGCDVVYGVQAQRKGGGFERWSGRCFYRFFTLLTGMPLPRNLVTARLMTRRYVDAVLRHEEREVFLAGLWFITGFTQHPQLVTKHHASKTTYTLSKKIAVLIDSITSFSTMPLILIFYTGMFISMVAALYILYIFIQWGFIARPLSGWSSVMASIWLLGGMIISFIGIIGIYLAKIVSETKRRPYTIVRQIYAKR
jgi:putative glycosyltransferase